MENSMIEERDMTPGQILMRELKDSQKRVVDYERRIVASEGHVEALRGHAAKERALQDGIRSALAKLCFIVPDSQRDQLEEPETRGFAA